MCGLAGAYGFIGPKEKQALSYLQIFSQIRGMDSTGVALVYNQENRKPEVLKSIGGLETLVFSEHTKGKFDLKDWTLNETGLLLAMSHHRKATMGVIDDDNAHPFEYKNIIGCHNGTIWRTDLKDFDSHDDKLIDSQIILQELNDTKDIKKVVPNLPKSGAWALNWWDKKESNLHFIRNDKRPLFIAHSEDKMTMFWASEAWMLLTALKRAGIKFEGKAYYLLEDHHYVMEKDKSKIEIVTREKVEGKSFFTRPPATGKKRGQQKVVGFHAPTKYDGPKQPANNPRPEVHEKKDTSNKFQEDYVETYLGIFTHFRKFAALVKEGCSNCQKTITWKDRHEVGWLDEETAVCKECKPQFENMLKEIKDQASTRKLH